MGTYGTLIVFLEGPLSYCRDKVSPSSSTQGVWGTQDSSTSFRGKNSLVGGSLTQGGTSGCDGRRNVGTSG